MGKQQFIVIGLEHYNPLGVIRSLGEAGINPIYIAIKHKCEIASLSRFVSEVRHAADIYEAYDVLISEYGKGTDKPYVITTDDDIQSLIDLHWNELKDRFVMFNAGASGRVTEFMDKMRILECAEHNGLRVLNTVITKRGTVPEGIEYPVITKSISPNDGGWKSDVHICASAAELADAFGRIQSENVLVQRFVDKQNEICVDGFAIDRGKQVFTPMYTTYNYNIRGYYSPYMTAHGFDLTDLSLGIQSMMAEIGFEGIFSAEFVVDSDGTPYFLEINFRNSTWSYIASKLGMPLPLLWARAMETGCISPTFYRPVPKNYKAMVEPIDHQKRVVENETSEAQWLSDFRNTDCLFYHNNNDPAPFEQMVANWDLLS